MTYNALDQALQNYGISYEFYGLNNNRTIRIVIKTGVKCGPNHFTFLEYLIMTLVEVKKVSLVYIPEIQTVDEANNFYKEIKKIFTQSKLIEMEIMFCYKLPKTKIYNVETFTSIKQKNSDIYSNINTVNLSC